MNVTALSERSKLGHKQLHYERELNGGLRTQRE